MYILIGINGKEINKTVYPHMPAPGRKSISRMKYSIFMYVYVFVQENLGFPNMYHSIMLIWSVEEIFSAKLHGRGVAIVD